jgi:VCBS repeat-containing protein
VTVQVTGVNSPPTANEDVVTANADKPLEAAAPGVLGNDLDPNLLDTLTVTGFDAKSAQGATVVVQPDGSYTYDPSGVPALQALASGESAQDSFQYTVSDNHGASSQATVYITVQGVNQPPTVKSASLATDANIPLGQAGPGLLANASDVNIDDTLTIVAANETSTLGATVNIDVDGSFTYDPTDAPALAALKPGEATTDHFNYQVDDGNGGQTIGVMDVVVTGVAPAKDVAGGTVPKLYQAILGRDADTGGLTYWTGQLDQQTPVADVAAGLWRSAEHRGIQVDQYYQSLLGRGADVAGRAYWIAAFAAGMTEAQVTNGFVLSDEYIAKHPGDAAFLTGIYNDLLGRDPEAGAFGLQTQAAPAPQATPELLASWAAGVLNSQEYHERVLDGLFSQFLHRQADEGASQAFLPALQSGAQDGVVALILSSSEFLGQP